MIGRLFTVFLRIGLFTFGGGYAMIPIIKHEITEKRNWIEEKDFLDLLTLAQSAPGPIALNSAVFVGYKVRGWWGAVAALAGVVVPSFAVLLAVAVFFAGIRDNEAVDAAFRALRPAVVALIAAPIAGFVKGMRWWIIGIAAAVAFAVWYTGISPVYFLIAGIVGGVLFAAVRIRKEGRV